ncbi:MAG TPA: HPr family phosphocarrier protein [Chlamydiales bacterium]|nr:HPr family phosphocarrier protein [Chlamydiales bacterium]
MKHVFEVKVKNQLGIHTRPATAIVKLLHRVKSNVIFTHKKDSINAKSILSILMLALHQNAKLTITVEGEDAQDVMEKLLQGFETCFGEC